MRARNGWMRVKKGGTLSTHCTIQITHDLRTLKHVKSIDHFFLSFNEHENNAVDTLAQNKANPGETKA
jgi:hypothetical protein